jgi:hypothetical protein
MALMSSRFYTCARTSLTSPLLPGKEEAVGKGKQLGAAFAKHDGSTWRNNLSNVLSAVKPFVQLGGGIWDLGLRIWDFLLCVL